MVAHDSARKREGGKSRVCVKCDDDEDDDDGDDDDDDRVKKKTRRPYVALLQMRKRDNQAIVQTFALTTRRPLTSEREGAGWPPKRNSDQFQPRARE
jgi:hypothetical protein